MEDDKELVKALTVASRSILEYALKESKIFAEYEGKELVHKRVTNQMVSDMVNELVDKEAILDEILDIAYLIAGEKKTDVLF
jgi:hypothetical protein